MGVTHVNSHFSGMDLAVLQEVCQGTQHLTYMVMARFLKVSYSGE